MVTQDSAEQEVRPTGTTRPRKRSLAELGGNRSAKPGAPHLSLNTPSPVVAVDQSGICFSVFFFVMGGTKRAKVSHLRSENRPHLG